MELHVTSATDGSVFAVPASLDSITTYVLLEQEDWFEKEVAFVRRFLTPGMTVIDIGANLGLYSIPMARLVGPAGAVFAYEPAGTTRALLETSRTLNACSSLVILASAVADRVGEAHLAHGTSSELNALSDQGAGEAVSTTSLDAEDNAARWARAPDFIKIDAEGAEDLVIDGGAQFFQRHSPLVMFEIKAGNDVNHALQARFASIGYRAFRSLGATPLLVPVAPGEAIDSYELNLFAAKPDRVTTLAAAGLLVERIPDWKPNSEQRRTALAPLGRLPLGRVFNQMLNVDRLDRRFVDGLAGFAHWRMLERPLAERCAALFASLTRLQTLCAAEPTLPRLATLARVAHEAGRREVAVKALEQLIERMMRGERQIVEPFWPACPRYDQIAPGNDISVWLTASIFEQYEKIAGFSSYFLPSRIDLGQMARTPFAAAEIERRRILQLAKAGQQPPVPARLCAAAPDHVNAELWRRGCVPGTVTEAAAS